MPKPPKISEAEWKIMKCIWRKSPQPAYDIAVELEGSDGMNAQMVKTLLNRLIKKKALGFKTYKNLYLYHPLVKEADCVHAESQSFLNQVFNGSWSTMMAHFAEHKKLSKKEIEELKRIIKEHESK